MQITTENPVVNNQPAINLLDQIIQKLRNSDSELNKLNQQISHLEKQRDELKEVQRKLRESSDLLVELFHQHIASRPTTFTLIKNLFLRFDASWLRKMTFLLKEVCIKAVELRKNGDKLCYNYPREIETLYNKYRKVRKDSDTYERFNVNLRLNHLNNYSCDLTCLLYTCAETDNVDLMKDLFAHFKEKIDINYQPKTKYGLKMDSLLMTAMFFSSPKVAEFLLRQKGIDVNAKDLRDLTACDNAVESGFTDGVRLIYTYHPEILNTTTISNEAIEIAKSQGYIETLKLLKSLNMKKHTLENTPTVWRRFLGLTNKVTNII